MVAIAGNDVIVGTDRRYRADGDRFLADVEMTEAANLSHAVSLGALLFEASNQQHLAKKPDEGFSIEILETVHLFLLDPLAFFSPDCFRSLVGNHACTTLLLRSHAGC